MSSDRIQLLKEILAALSDEVAAMKFPIGIKEQFAFLQVTSIKHLSGSLLVLYENQKMEAVGCLMRPLIEGFLNLRAGVNDPVYAASKSVSDMNKFVRHLERLRDNCEPGTAKDQFTEVIATNTTTLSNLVNRHNVSVRNWNAREIAEKGKCIPLYENAYPFFHTSVHSGVDGILLQPSDRYAELVFDLASAVLIDTFSTTIHHLAPEKLPSYDEQFKAWVTERERILAVS